MWLKAAICILNSNEFQVRLHPVFKGYYHGPGFLLSLFSAFHAFSSMPRLHSGVCSTQDYITEKECCGQSFTPFHQLQWEKDQMSSSSWEKEKASRKKKFFNPAKVSFHLFNWTMCPNLNQFPWSGDWAIFIGTILKLRWNQLLRNGEEGIFLGNLWVPLWRSR